MKKVYLLAIATAAVLVGCSSNDVVNDIPGSKMTREVPIGFSVQKQNITRATSNLENVKHYNFGVWAWKVNPVSGTTGLADAEVMNNYLVGWSNGTDKGYDKTGATTWAATPGTVAPATSAEKDHYSPWFYEGLGSSEYSGTSPYYTTSDADYMSKNANQYLRYWDLAYANTNFYCYAPYNKNVTFDKATNIMTFPATGAIRDGYDEYLNSGYNAHSRTLGEFMYAGVQATNSSLSDVTVPFKHMGAQLFIRFYEDIPGYRVEIIDLGAHNGTMATGTPSTSGVEITADMAKGIQAAPSLTPTHTIGTYYTTSGATINYSSSMTEPVYTPSWTSSTSVSTPLMFKIPTAGLSTAGNAPDNLSAFTPVDDGNPSTTDPTYNVIPEKVTTGVQTYSYSPTIYYPVAQPTTSTTGFTFHVSYRLIAKDNGEVITVHNATVHVPVTGTVVSNNETDPVTPSDDTHVASGSNYYITAWQPNVKYTYTFKITKNSTGTTNPTTTIDPTDPTPSSIKSLYPIVFDAATIDDYSVNYSEYTVSESTTY